jgi:hypothetical protein
LGRNFAENVFDFYCKVLTVKQLRENVRFFAVQKDVLGHFLLINKLVTAWNCVEKRIEVRRIAVFGDKYSESARCAG